MSNWPDTSKDALLASSSSAPSLFRAPTPSHAGQTSRPSSSLANRVSREFKERPTTNIFDSSRNANALIYPQELFGQAKEKSQSRFSLGRPVSQPHLLQHSNQKSALVPLVNPIACFVTALVLAIGHHEFNTSVKGKIVGVHPSIPQDWIFRIGTAFAIAFQTILAVSLAFVVCQLLWFYVRRQYLSIHDINTLYLVERRELVPTILSNAALHSPLLVTATLLSFLLPITAVFTPSSLGVTASSFDVTGPCQVSAGNFSNLDVPALFRHNITKGNLLGGAVTSLQRMVDATFASQSIPPLPQYCGKNCTYQTSLDSFTFQCETGVTLPDGQLGTVPLSYLGPGTRAFWNATMNGPWRDPPSPFYVGWQTGAMYLRFDGSVGTNGSALCTPTRARYDFNVQNINGEQIVSYNMTPGEPLLSTANPPADATIDEIYDSLQLGAVVLAARSRLLGSISWNYFPVSRVSITNDSAPVVMGAFLNISASDAFIWGDVITGIEQTAANVTATLLNVNLGLKDSECTYSRTELVYRYRPANLWLPYSIALATVGSFLVLGVVLFIHFNPENLSTSFVDTIGLTRNPELDSLAVRYSLGLSDTFDDGDSKTFRLGQLGYGYAGFGTRQCIRSPT